MLLKFMEPATYIQWAQAEESGLKKFVEKSAAAAKNCALYSKKALEILFPIPTLVKSTRKLLLNKTDKIHKHCFRIFVALAAIMGNAAVIGKVIAWAGVSVITAAPKFFQTLLISSQALGVAAGLLGAGGIAKSAYDLTSTKRFYQDFCALRKTGTYTRSDWEEIKNFFDIASVEKHLQISGQPFLTKIETLSKEIQNANEQEVNDKINNFLMLTDLRITTILDNHIFSLVACSINTLAVALYFTPLAPLSLGLTIPMAITLVGHTVEKRIQTYLFENKLELIDRNKSPLGSIVKDFFKWNFGQLNYNIA